MTRQAIKIKGNPRKPAKSRSFRLGVRINIPLAAGSGIQKVANTIAPTRLLHPRIRLKINKWFA